MIDADGVVTNFSYAGKGNLAPSLQGNAAHFLQEDNGAEVAAAMLAFMQATPLAAGQAHAQVGRAG